MKKAFCFALSSLTLAWSGQAAAQAVPSIDPALLEQSRRMMEGPGDQRPGDDKLTCAQINAEMGALWGTMDKEVGTLGKTAKNAQDEQKRLQAEPEKNAARRAAPTVASEARVAAQETFNPIAAKAAQRREEAEMKAQAERDLQRSQPARNAMNEHAAASGELLRTGMQGGQFERMHALQQLAERKKCPAPHGLDKKDDEDDRPSEAGGAKSPGMGDMLRGLLGR